MAESEETQRRIDALDMIISVLQRHEENLDKLCSRLESLIELISATKKEEEVPSTKGVTLMVKTLSDWNAYREKVQSPTTITFDINNFFYVCSEVGGILYRYIEPLLTGLEGVYEIKKLVEEEQREPTVIRLKCGLEFPFVKSKTFNSKGELHFATHITIDISKVKSWLSKQLNISEDRIYVGRIEI